MGSSMKPDAVEIADDARALLKSGETTPEIALEGLHSMIESLRQDFQYTDEELKPITDLIFELKIHGHPLPP